MADQLRPAKKLKGRASTSHNAPLQAIVLPDSFEQKFLPITLERPKVLLPLVNKPMIEYTLEWLKSEGVGEVFVFCCPQSHSEQINSYLNKSGWCSKPNFSVTTIDSSDSVSDGDALRLIDKRNVIHGDFVLISGDTVTNMSLTKALQEHKDRKKNYNSALMTMVINESLPDQSGLVIDNLFMAIHPDTNQLLYYDPSPKDNPGSQEDIGYLVKKLPHTGFHNDQQDCYIDICSREVLSLFTRSVHYQHRRDHLVQRLLEYNMTGFTIFTVETYANRVDNFRSYGTISNSIMQTLKDQLVSPKMLKAPEYELDKLLLCGFKTLQRGGSAVIGAGTSIGANTEVLNSVIGEGCSIGRDVSIEGCYIWNNVTIQDGCKLKDALICDKVILKSGAVVNPGVVLSFNVVIGQDFVVPAYAKVSLRQQPIGQVGRDGDGYIWSVCGSREEKWSHSVAQPPSPAD